MGYFVDFKPFSSRMGELGNGSLVSEDLLNRLPTGGQRVYMWIVRHSETGIRPIVMGFFDRNGE